MKKTYNIEKISNIITSVGFVILLSGMLVLCIIIPDKASSEMENRKLQQLPEMKIADILNGDYMEDFEVYASDNVTYRDGWVEMKNAIDRISGKKDNGSVYFGSDDYLFPIEPIDDIQLGKNLEYTKNFIENVKKKNKEAKISVLIVPTAAEILKEKLPKYAVPFNQMKILRPAENCFGEMFVNLLPILKEHSNEYIYYKTDHHWTSLGAYYAYRAWAESNGVNPLEKDEFVVQQISDDFYGTTYSKAVSFRGKPDYIEKFSNTVIDNASMTVKSANATTKSESIFDRTYLKTKDKYSYFLSGNNSLCVINSGIDNGKKLLVVKDSYANSFIPFMTEHFGEIYVVDMRYYKENPVKLIEANRITDVLILYNTVQFANDRNLAYIGISGD